MIKLPKYKYYFAIGDFISINSAFILTVLIAENFNFNGGMSGWIELCALSLVSSSVFIFFFQNNNLYKINVILSNSLQIIAILRSLFYGTILMIVVAFWLKLPFILDSRKFLIIFSIILLFILLLERLFIMRPAFRRLSNSELLKRKILIIGAGKAGKTLAAKLELEKNLGFAIVGFIDDNIPIGQKIIDKKMVLGTTDDINKIVDDYKIDEIIIAIDNISYERLLEIIDKIKLLGVTTRLTSDTFEIIPQKIFTEKYSDIDVVNLSVQVNEKINFLIKRIIDYVGASVGLVLLSPLFIILAIIIKATSRGPVFYKQVRIGKDGKPFEFMKFRSMTVDEGEDEERKKMMIEFMKNGNSQKQNSTKIINESRVTWIGKIIRKYSIDELPQLINVLKGEMSLVGPRPCLPYEYENYDEWQKKRLSVLPGCTGVWQVFGRSNVSFKDSVILDIYYINNMSPWLDLQLIFKTIPVMLLAKGGE